MIGTGNGASRRPCFCAPTPPGSRSSPRPKRMSCKPISGASWRTPEFGSWTGRRRISPLRRRGPRPGLRRRPPDVRGRLSGPRLGAAFRSRQGAGRPGHGGWLHRGRRPSADDRAPASTRPATWCWASTRSATPWARPASPPRPSAMTCGQRRRDCADGERPAKSFSPASSPPLCSPPMPVHPTLEAVTARIAERSAPTRRAYLDLIARRARERRRSAEPRPAATSPTPSPPRARTRRRSAAGKAMNIAIVTAYNDMLSAHQPYGRYPEQMKLFAREAGATAQVAGGVPAMCDGVTQGQRGMELSLFSRDTIALSTAVALSHGMFEGAALLGICDKIVPGLLIGALRFGHLPTHPHSRRPDAVGPRQQGKAARPPALRRGQGRPRRTARSRSGQLSRGRHLHLLRHRQLPTR